MASDTGETAERESIAAAIYKSYLADQLPNGGGFNDSWLRSFSLKAADAVIASGRST